MNIAAFLTQSYGKLTFLDLILICTYLVLCLYVGFKNAGKIKNIKDYALGSGKISTAALVATLYATHLGAGSTIGMIQRITEVGALFAIIVLLSPMRFIVSLAIYRHIEQFRGCITSSDIMARLYDTPGRFVMNISILTHSIATVAAQTAAVGYLLHYFLEIPMAAGMILGSGTLIFYSVLGGIRAVIITDMLQFSLFYVILPVLCAVFMRQTGGWTAVAALVPEDKWHFTWQTKDQMWMFYSGLLWMFLPLEGGPFIQRFLISMSNKQLTQALSIATILDCSIAVMVCLFGFVTIAATKGLIAPQDIVWYAIDSKLWGLLKGAFVVSVLALIMSTADSYLNNAGVLFARDLIKPNFTSISDYTEVMIARIFTGVAGAIAILMVIATPRILDLLWIAINFYYPLIIVPLAAGFLYFRTNSVSFLFSVSFAIIGVFIGAKLQGKLDVLSTVFGITGSAIGLFGAHRLQQIFGVLNNVARQEKIDLAQWYEEQAVTLKVSAEQVPTELRRLAREKQKSLNPRGLTKKVATCLKWLTDWRFRDLIFYSQRAVEKHEARYYEFAIFGLCFCIYPLLFLNSTYELHPTADQSMWLTEMVLRICVGFGCLSIGLQHMWNKATKKKYMPLYFHFILMCALPALSTYAYLVSPNDDRMLTGGVLAIFSLALLVDWRTFAGITSIGFILGNITYMFFGHMVEHPRIYHDTINGALLYILLSIIMACLLRFVQEKHTDKLYYMATTDALTDLANRHHLNIDLTNLVEDAHARNKDLSIIALDIDYFKRLNDTYGHDAGDAVLQELGRVMKEGARPLDICARLGGEEFLIVLPGTDLNEVALIAERLRSKIATDPFNINIKPYSINCTISLGVTTLRLKDTPKSLMRRADKALYKAKGKGHEGRNRVVVATKNAMEIWLQPEA